MTNEQRFHTYITFTLASRDGVGWTIDWGDVVPHMIMGGSAREVIEKMLAQVCPSPPVEPPASHIDAFLAMALPRIADLMEADPEDATPEGRELLLLADLADRYERQKYPEFSGRPVKPHRSGGGGPPAPEPPIEVLPRHPNRSENP